jgi:transcriptional regulator with XRE-family HTH domain
VYPDSQLHRFERLPLAALIARARLSRSLSLNDVAILVRKTAREEGSNTGATRQTVHSWEQGVIPRPDSLRWLSRALGLSLDAVVHAAAAQEAMVTRRQVLRGAIVVGGGFLSLTRGQPDSLERLNRAFTGSPVVDETTLDYLDRRVSAYWQDYYVGKAPAPLLLPYALEDLDRVTTLLEGSLVPSVRVRLSALAGRAATMTGALHWDMGAYGKARDFMQTAVIAAREGRDQCAETVAWAWSSLAWNPTLPSLIVCALPFTALKRLARSVSLTLP